jgi:hypothetical protein
MVVVCPSENATTYVTRLPKISRTLEGVILELVNSNVVVSEKEKGQRTPKPLQMS